MVVISSSLVHDGERQAAVDAAPVDQHRAGAALAVVAALLAAVSPRCSRQRSSREARMSGSASRTAPLIVKRTPSPLQ
jgi:hypothetical protein